MSVSVRPIVDPLGDGVEVSLALPGWEPVHDWPERELAAYEAAGLDAVTVVFIDAPTNDLESWPEADRRFLAAVMHGHEEIRKAVPGVWARVRTTPRPLIVPPEFEYETSSSPSEGGPSDFYGTSLAEAQAYAAKEEGRLRHHQPPGDGWHRAAWMPTMVQPGWAGYECECDIAVVEGSPRGGRLSLSRSDCPYKAIAAYVRGLQQQPTLTSRGPEVLRELLDRALAGEWLGQPSGSAFWGSNLYAQTASVVLDIDWGEVTQRLAPEAVRQGLVSMEGMILVPPRPPRRAPDGPLTGWDDEELSDDAAEWVVWCERLDGRYLVEVVDDDNGARLRVYDHDEGETLVAEEAVVLSYGAVFGPDVGDIEVWRETAVRLVDGA